MGIGVRGGDDSGIDTDDDDGYLRAVGSNANAVGRRAVPLLGDDRRAGEHPMHHTRRRVHASDTGRAVSPRPWPQSRGLFHHQELSH